MSNEQPMVDVKYAAAVINARFKTYPSTLKYKEKGESDLEKLGIEGIAPSRTPIKSKITVDFQFVASVGPFIDAKPTGEIFKDGVIITLQNGVIEKVDVDMNDVLRDWKTFQFMSAGIMDTTYSEVESEELVQAVLFSHEQIRS